MDPVPMQAEDFNEVKNAVKYEKLVPREDFAGFLVESIESVKQAHRQYFLEELKKSISEDDVEKFVDGLLGGTLQPDDIAFNDIAFNAEIDCESQMREILQECASLSNVNDIHFLIISAPLDNEGDRRLQEANCFVRKLFESSANKPKTEFAYCLVYNTEDIKRVLKKFFGNGVNGVSASGEGEGLSASGALISIVVFLGHGTEAGFALKGDGIPYSIEPLDNIVQLSLKLFKQAVELDSHKLPAMCEIVFSQCYGHMYDQAAKCDKCNKLHSYRQPSKTGDQSVEQSKDDCCKRFQVVHFTKCGSVYTTSIKYKLWEHQALNRYANGKLDELINVVEDSTANTDAVMSEVQDTDQAMHDSDNY